MQMFEFLKDHDRGRLYRTLVLAADRAWDDPRAALVHQRRFHERLIDYLSRKHGLNTDHLDYAMRGILVARHTSMPPFIHEFLHRLRKLGNSAAHHIDAPLDESHALGNLRCSHEIAIWFHRHRDGRPVPECVFEVPPDPREARRQIEKERDVWRAQAERYKEELAHYKQEAERARAAPSERPPKERDAALSLVRLYAKQVERAGATASAPEPKSLTEAIPPGDTLKWLYFATPAKANRDTTYEFANEDFIVCCDAHKSNGNRTPLVKDLQAGDLLLLAYKQADGRYEAKVFLRIDEPGGPKIEGTHVMYKLPDVDALWQRLQAAGYDRDPHLKEFTGFSVTPARDVAGLLPDTFAKPIGQNYLRQWEEVRAFQQNRSGSTPKRR